jgi:hypothetical protein
VKSEKIVQSVMYSELYSGFKNHAEVGTNEVTYLFNITLLKMDEFIWFSFFSISFFSQLIARRISCF